MKIKKCFINYYFSFIFVKENMNNNNQITADSIVAISKLTVPIGNNLTTSNANLTQNQGTIAFDQTTQSFVFGNGGNTPPSAVWFTTGNLGTSPPTNFIGTKDNNNFLIVTNNNVAGGTRFNTNGAIEPLSALFNLFVGQNAGPPSGITGNSNTSFGYNSSHANVSANDTTAVGTNCLANNTVTGNTAMGFNSMTNNTIGAGCAAFGVSALAANISGNNNSAFGSFSAFNNTFGFSNSSFGSESLSAVTTGSQNTTMGAFAMQSNLLGSQNIGIGGGSLQFGTNINDCTSVGFLSLRNNTGNNNIAMGASAGINLTSGSNNIDIGNGGVAGESATIRIGDGPQTKCFIAGIAGAGPIAGGVNVIIDLATGQLGTVPSAEKYKENIENMNDFSSAIYNLRPVIYNDKRDSTKTISGGVIANEAIEVLPTFVSKDAKGEIETFQYQNLIPLLLNEQIKTKKELNTQIEINYRLNNELIKFEERLRLLESK